MKQNEINDKILDSTIPWFDQSSLDDISTSTQKPQKKGPQRRKLKLHWSSFYDWFLIQATLFKQKENES